jgi:hypothetical protein
VHPEDRPGRRRRGEAGDGIAVYGAAWRRRRDELVCAQLLDTTAGERELARRAWSHLEVIHAVGIFGPEVIEAHGSLGIDDLVSGYVAARVAPVGRVGPEVAGALFHGFAPAVMRRALPAVWELAAPETIIEVTRRAAGETLDRLVEGLEDELARASELAREASLFHPLEGRALAAGRSALGWPDEPHLVLWEAATRIRESRGDGHVACLVAAGLDGVEAHLTVAGDTKQAHAFLKGLRGWSDAEWEAAVRRLRDRGLLDAGGGLTPAGRELRDELEVHTDALAVPPWRQLGTDATERLLEALRPIVYRILDAEILPMPIFKGKTIDPRGPEAPEAHGTTDP